MISLHEFSFSCFVFVFVCLFVCLFVFSDMLGCTQLTLSG